MCLEPFTETGEECPKLLPCSHTLCVKCLLRIEQEEGREEWWSEGGEEGGEEEEEWEDWGQAILTPEAEEPEDGGQEQEQEQEEEQERELEDQPEEHDGEEQQQEQDEDEGWLTTTQDEQEEEEEDVFRCSFITCPECRAVSSVPEGGVHLFPTNRYILELLTMMATGPLHQGAWQQGAPQPPTECDVHHKSYVKLCVEDPCCQAICRKCLHNEHQGHVVLDINENVNQVKYLQDVEEHVAKTEQELEEFYAKLEERREEVVEEQNTAEAIIDTEVQSLIDSIVEEADDMKKKIRNQAEEEIEKLDKMQQGVSKRVSLGLEISQQLSDLRHTTIAENVEALSNALEKYVDFRETSAENSVSDVTTSCRVLRVEPRRKRTRITIGKLKPGWLGIAPPPPPEESHVVPAEVDHVTVTSRPETEPDAETAMVEPARVKKKKKPKAEREKTTLMEAPTSTQTPTTTPAGTQPQTLRPPSRQQTLPDIAPKSGRRSMSLPPIQSPRRESTALDPLSFTSGPEATSGAKVNATSRDRGLLSARRGSRPQFAQFERSDDDGTTEYTELSPLRN